MLCFFQAEDGIRDIGVTGVQTCALPIFEAAAFDTLAQGEVLVAPFTSPAWTPLFVRAAAVVVDSGGPASHAAIVAREYSIPAVMATVDGTRRLADGQMVRVDGSRGLVSQARRDGSGL